MALLRRNISSNQSVALLGLFLVALASSVDYCHAAEEEETHGIGTATATTSVTDEHADMSTFSSGTGEGQHGEHGDDHHEAHEVYAVIFPWFIQAIGILVYFLLTRYVHAVPYTAVLFIVGILMGVGGELRGDANVLGQSIQLWTGIDNEVLFTVFLPGLLFKDALEINFHLLTACIWQLLWLAFPLVLISTILTALVGFYVFPYGWSWYMSLTFGCILAATDPVAVSALLNEVGAPPRLKIHISGESLLNDGSAVVFFFVFGGLFLHEVGIVALGEDSTVGEAFALFFRMALGGAGIGLAFAIALRFVLYKLDRRQDKEEIVLQVTATVTIAYLSFFVSEVVAGCSGVIAVVTTGIFTKAFAAGLISDWKVMDSFWSLLEHLLNTVIFALGGTVFGSIITRDTWQGKDWGYLFVLFILVNIIRFICLFGSFPLTSRIGLKTTWQETVFASAGGLRGAVGITLALGLDNIVIANTEDETVRMMTTELFGMVGGIALLTLCINGPLCGPLLIRLGLADSTDSRKHIIKCAEESTRRRVLDDFLHLMTDERFFFVDFALVQYHCKFLRDVTAQELKDAVDDNKASVHPDIYKAPNLNQVLPYIKDASSLRASIVQAQRDIFMAPVNFQEERTILKDIAEDVEEAAPKEEADPTLLKETRLLFLELLRAAYTAQVRDGELDAREYNGFLLYDLEQSVEFAHDAVSGGSPLNDWKTANELSIELYLRSEATADRLALSCCGKGKGVKERIDALVDVASPLEYQRLRLNVLRALSFIDAHKEAQDRLQDELAGNHLHKNVDTTRSIAAFKEVMKESKGEVRKAKEVLKSQNKKKLKHVISHYLCIIIQNKTARYIKLLLDSGVLLQKEARHFLEEIDEDVRHIRKCPLFGDHPGSTQSAQGQTESPGVDNDESNEDFFMDAGLSDLAEATVAPSVGPGAMQKQRTMRRKRVKQKSIL